MLPVLQQLGDAYGF